MVTKKKEVMSVLSLLIVLISITNTYATSKATEIQRGILPNWQNTSDITVALTINNEKAVLSTAIEGKRNVNKLFWRRSSCQWNKYSSTPCCGSF